MFEKVNPSHPDKIADRIAGALVDIAYQHKKDPCVAVEVLIGHGSCFICGESNYQFQMDEALSVINRICPSISNYDIQIMPHDARLAENQANGYRAGDNGVFRGVPVSDEEKLLGAMARAIYDKTPSDGKYIIDYNREKPLIICQSRASESDISPLVTPNSYTFNPLGAWTGGTDVDTGATNRKLGSDMGRSVTGGGLHGKDLSKADVSVNIYAHLLAQKRGKEVEMSCAIGDKEVVCTVEGETTRREPYDRVVEVARDYIRNIGGFEAFAAWGLI